MFIATITVALDQDPSHGLRLNFTTGRHRGSRSGGIQTAVHLSIGADRHRQPGKRI